MKPAFLVVHKPAGITSHDVVAAVRAVLGVKKVGHTGTLDPFATGVLPLALGPATKLIQFVDESLKVYDALIRFGSATDTGDPTGTVIREAPLPTADRQGLDAVLEGFLGERMQKPPAYSAVKHAGKPLYHYARKGQEVEVAARPVTIYRLEVLSYSPEQLELRISCSRGTYARVLADEIATALGSAGHLEALERPRSGPFLLSDAITLDEISKFAAPDTELGWKEILFARSRTERIQWRPRDEVREKVEPWLRRPLNILSHLPLTDVKEQDAARVRRGGTAPPPPTGVGFGGRYLCVNGDELLAVAEWTPRGANTLRAMDERAD